MAVLPAYRESISAGKWMYRPEIQLIRYNIDLEIEKWLVPPERNNPFFYCYWNKTPGAEIHVGSRTYPLSPEYIMLIPPNLEHSPVQTAPFNHSFIHFIALPPFNALHSIELIPAEKFIHLFRRRENESLTSLSLYSLIFELFLEIPKDRFCHRQITDERIHHVCTLFSRCKYAMPLQEIAENLHMSVSSLSHLFKKETGVSPIHYLMERRLEKALMLLADRQLSINDVALKTGFADRYHFSKAFKTQYGKPPAQVRKELMSRHGEW